MADRGLVVAGVAGDDARATEGVAKVVGLGPGRGGGASRRQAAGRCRGRAVTRGLLGGSGEVPASSSAGAPCHRTRAANRAWTLAVAGHGRLTMRGCGHRLPHQAPSSAPALEPVAALPHQAPRRPGRAHEVAQVRDRLHVARLARVDRRRSAPTSSVQPAAQAHGDHLDLELEPGLAAVRASPSSAAGPGAGSRTGCRGCAGPPPTRTPRSPTVFDSRRTGGIRAKSRRPMISSGRGPDAPGARTPRRTAGSRGVVLAVRVEREDGVVPLVQRAGSRPGALRPCPGWGPGGAPPRPRPRRPRPCRRSSRRPRRAPAGGRVASTTRPIRGPSS